MKKAKIATCLILLCLCTAIIGVGVYVALPTNNLITGSVTLNPIVENVDVDLYINEVLISSHDGVNSAITLTEGLENLVFKTHWTNGDGEQVQADVPEQVEDIVLRFHIKNKTGKALVAFFSQNATSSQSNFITSSSINATLSNGSTIQIANVSLSGLTNIEAFNKSNLTDEADVTITFECANLVEEDVRNLAFSYYLNILETA